MINQLQDFYDCLAVGLDLLISVFDQLNLKFAGVTINLYFLVGASVVCMIYHHIMGSDETQEEYDLFSYYDDEEY